MGGEETDKYLGSVSLPSGSVSLYHNHRECITSINVSSEYADHQFRSVIGARSDPRIKRLWRKIKPLKGCDLHLIVFMII